MRTRSWMMAVGLAAAGALHFPGCGNLPLPQIEVDFELGTGLGEFEVEADVPLLKTGTGSFNTGGTTIGRGSFEIDIGGITVTPADGTGDKAAVTQQANTVLEVTVWIASIDLVDTVCEVGEQYGPYTVTLDGNYVPVAIAPNTITLTSSTIDLLNAGEFSLCIRVLSPVTGTVRIGSFTFHLGL